MAIKTLSCLTLNSVYSVCGSLGISLSHVSVDFCTLLVVLSMLLNYSSY